MALVSKSGPLQQKSPIGARALMCRHVWPRDCNQRFLNGVACQFTFSTVNRNAEALHDTVIGALCSGPIGSFGRLVALLVHTVLCARSCALPIL